MWIWHNLEALQGDPLAGGLSRDELAETLAAESPDHPLWVHCARVTMRTIRQTVGDLIDEELGTGARPRVIAPDLEVIRLLPVKQLPKDELGYAYFPPGMSIVGLSLIVRLVDEQWRVAGIHKHVLLPGWPPSHVKLVGPED